jgi:hypothetical protein
MSFGGGLCLGLNVRCRVTLGRKRRNWTLAVLGGARWGGRLRGASLVEASAQPWRLEVDLARVSGGL